MKLRPYQQDFVNSDYKFLFWWMRLGKTYTSLSCGKKRYPDLLPIIITKNAIIKSNLHPLSTGGWLKESKIVYGEDFELVHYISDKTKILDGGIILGSHHSKIKSLIENKNIDLSKYYLILDEMHEFKNPGVIKIDSVTGEEKIEGKRGYYASILAGMMKARIFGLTATPSGIGYIDYANYFIMLGEYIDIDDFKNQHVNYVTVPIRTKFKTRYIKQIDHNNYSNLDKLEYLIGKYCSVMDRNRDELVEYMGEEPILEIIGIKNHKSLKVNMKNKSHYNTDGIKLELIDFDLINYRHRFSYGYLDTKNEKIQKIINLLEDNNRLVVFYSYTQDLITISRAINLYQKVIKENIVVQVLRGSSKINDFEYVEYDRETFDKCNKAILLVQYDAGAEGLTLYDVASVIVHYSLPNKYYLYKQSSARTDGPIMGSYGVATNIVLVTDCEIDKFNALNNKKDYDVTISTHMF